MIATSRTYPIANASPFCEARGLIRTTGTFTNNGTIAVSFGSNPGFGCIASTGLRGGAGGASSTSYAAGGGGGGGIVHLLAPVITHTGTEVLAFGAQGTTTIAVTTAMRSLSPSPNSSSSSNTSGSSLARS